MAQKTKIEWTDATWNPITGCAKISAGCANCYAETMFKRFSANLGDFGTPKLHDNRLSQPLRWKKPMRIFVCSTSDLFYEGIPDVWIDKVFEVIRQCPQHTFMILTKRPTRMKLYVRAHTLLSNVWLGVTVEDGSRTWRLDDLLETPAAKHFVSCEPLLDKFSLLYYVRKHQFNRYTYRLDWVIAGGETGVKARPASVEAVKSLHGMCINENIPFFFKQWGSKLPPEEITNEDFKNGTIDGETIKRFPR